MTSAIEIFCCYSRKDQEMLENLKSHLAPLRRHGLITIWNDTDISPGSNYEDEIKKHLDSANIILLLVSPDFMNSDYCYSTEMERAMERHNKGETRVVPIILRPVLFKDAPFGKLQALPTDAKPVKRWTDPDEAFFDVAEGIKKVAEDLILKQYLSGALSLFDAGQYTEAIPLLDWILRLEPTHAGANRWKGEALQQLGKYSEALDLYEKLEQAQTTLDDPYLYADKGRALKNLARFEDALTSYQKAIDFASDNSDFHLEKAELLSLLKRYDEALDVYDQLIRLEPNQVYYCQIEKGKLFIKLKRFEEALAVYSSLLQRDPNIAAVHKGKALALMSLKHYHKALPVLAEATRLNPADADVQKVQGDALYHLERYKDALKSYEQAIQLDPNNTSGYTGKGDVLAKLESYEDALNAYEQAISLNPNEPANYGGKATVHEQLAQKAHLKASQLFADQFTLLRTLRGHSASVRCVFLSEDGQRLISGSYDKTIKVWDMHTGQVVKTLTGQKFGVTSVALSADGQILASGSEDRTIKVWDMHTGRVVTTLTGHSGIVDSVALSADGQILASGSKDKTIKVWDMQTGRVVTTLTEHSGIVGSVALSADGQTLASRDEDGTIKIWDMQIEQVTKIIPGFLAYTLGTETEQELRTLTRYSGPVGPTTLRVDKQILISRNHSNIEFWYMQTEQELRTLVGHSKTIYCLVLSADGQTLVSGSGDRTIRIWGKL